MTSLSKINFKPLKEFVDEKNETKEFHFKVIEKRMFIDVGFNSLQISDLATGDKVKIIYDKTETEEIVRLKVNNKTQITIPTKCSIVMLKAFLNSCGLSKGKIFETVLLILQNKSMPDLNLLQG